MADPRRALPGNAPGPWFVDDSCSGCDASRQCAPGLFVEADGATVVARQPETPDELRAATRALLACPEGSIGARGVKLDLAVFPEEVEPGSGVSLAGFNSPRAYGGNAWLVRRPWGTALVDGPRFTAHLVRTLEGWGGLSDILLTHRDDLGDAEAYARHFGARVWVHEAEAAAVPFATDLLRGQAPVTLRPGLEALPVPGHTRGSVLFRLDGRFLFTGDSLFWSRGLDTLHAHRRQCWYSWPAQRASLGRLVGVDFEWVLPGHGGRAHRAAPAMQAALAGLLRRMEDPAWRDAW